jgi:hypothetical protein
MTTYPWCGEGSGDPREHPIFERGNEFYLPDYFESLVGDGYGLPKIDRPEQEERPSS